MIIDLLFVTMLLGLLVVGFCLFAINPRDDINDAQ